jgi:hypothetical protein
VLLKCLVECKVKASQDVAVTCRPAGHVRGAALTFIILEFDKQSPTLPPLLPLPPPIPKTCARRTHTSCTMSAALLTNVDQKLLRKTKFPPEFDQKVNMEKVNVPVIKKWVADEVARILNNDDDIVTELIYNVLEESPYVGGLGYMSQGLS